MSLGAVTVSVAWDVAFVPEPVAVSVKVVVAAGALNVCEPEAGRLLPTPLSMLTAVAFVVAHVNVTCVPAAALDGLTVNDFICGPLLLPGPDINPPHPASTKTKKIEISRS